MFQEILTKIDFISPIFYQILYMTVVGSIVGLIIYFIRNIFDNKISGKWKCIMWSIVLVALLVPIRFEIKTEKNIPKIQNEIIEKVEDIKNIGSYEYIERAPEKLIDTQNIQNNSEIEPNTENIIQFENTNISAEIKNRIPFKTLAINIIIPYIWLLGVIIFILTFLSGIGKINKRISRNVYRDERVELILNQCKKQLNIKKKVKIILQKYKKVPSIFGIFNPSILITEKTLQEDNETIKYIFLHELAHYKRKDIVFNFVLLCTLSIHWFNPVIWFLFNKIRQDIEIGADELASKKLNKSEKKEYGMVLINLLRNKQEENYTANMLCMSDTGKNMERRILMIKGKSKSIILSFLIVSIVIGVVAGFVFVKVVNVEDLTLFDELNLLSQNENVEPVTEQETEEIREYIDEICNQYYTYTLPEFSGINNADRYWIYAHLKIKNDGYGFEDSIFTKEEIKEYLKNIFGDELVIDVEKDLPELEPLLNSAKGLGFPDRYVLLITGDMVVIEYIIDDIRKENNEYIVNVVEYTNSRDIERNMDYNSAVYAYEENDNEYMQDWKRIFSSDGMRKEEIVSRVLNRKNEFRAFNITLVRDDMGKLRVKGIKLNTERNENNNEKVTIVDRRADSPSYIKDRGELKSSGLWSLDGYSSNYEISLIDNDMIWNNNSGLYHKIITTISDYNKYNSRLYNAVEMTEVDFEKSFLVIITNENFKPKDEVDLYVYDVRCDDTTTHIIMKQKENPITHYLGIGSEPEDGKSRNYESDNNVFYAIVDKSKLKDNVDVIIEH